MPRSTPTLVFADVDGVLGHPEAQVSPEAAQALKRLERDDVRLVFCSSKTRAEVERIQQDLGILHPFVSESGGAIFVPVSYFSFDVPSNRELPGYHSVEFGRPYVDVVRVLRQTASRQGIEIIGFSDLSVEEVARECRLPLPQARLAKLREYGERFRLLDSSRTARDRLFKALEAARLHCLVGESHHQVGASVDSSAAIGLLHALYKRAFGALVTVGSGVSTPGGSVIQFFDRRIRVPHDGKVRDVVAWVELLIDGVERLRFQRNRSVWRD